MRTRAVTKYTDGSSLFLITGGWDSFLVASTTNNETGSWVLCFILEYRKHSIQTVVWKWKENFKDQFQIILCLFLKIIPEKLIKWEVEPAY